VCGTSDRSDFSKYGIGVDYYFKFVVRWQPFTHTHTHTRARTLSLYVSICVRVSVPLRVSVKLQLPPSFISPLHDPYNTAASSARLCRSS
jgi:hypothetical protein